MKQITSFNIARLRVEEDFGFLKLVVAETDCLISDSDSPDEISVPAASTPVTLTTSIATFKSAVDTFDNALKDSATVPSSAIAAEADTARDNAWRGANNYLKAMTAHPTETVRKTAAEVKTLFDKYGDSGFVEYITETRIASAKEMLEQGDLKVYEIAEKLGYESAFYFSKVFKKVTGLSPREYQQSI